MQNQILPFAPPLKPLMARQGDPAEPADDAPPFADLMKADDPPAQDPPPGWPAPMPSLPPPVALSVPHDPAGSGGVSGPDPLADLSADLLPLPLGAALVGTTAAADAPMFETVLPPPLLDVPEQSADPVATFQPEAEPAPLPASRASAFLFQMEHGQPAAADLSATPEIAIAFKDRPPNLPRLPPPDSAPKHGDSAEQSQVGTQSVAQTTAPPAQTSGGQIAFAHRQAADPIAKSAEGDSVPPDAQDLFAVITSEPAADAVSLPQTPAPLKLAEVAVLSRLAEPAASAAPHTQQLARAIAVTPPGGTVSLVLAPAELGQLRFGLRQKGDRIVVTLSAERADTLDLLRRNLPDLVGELKTAGFANSSFEFETWQGGDRSAPKRPEPPPSDSPAAPARISEPSRPPAPRHSGQLDLRV